MFLIEGTRVIGNFVEGTCFDMKTFMCDLVSMSSIEVCQLTSVYCFLITTQAVTVFCGMCGKGELPEHNCHTARVKCPASREMYHTVKNHNKHCLTSWLVFRMAIIRQVQMSCNASEKKKKEKTLVQKNQKSVMAYYYLPAWF